MTIKSRLIISPDLFSDNETFLLRKEDARALGYADINLAGITFEAERASLATPLDELTTTCVEAFLSYKSKQKNLAATKTWMLLALGPWADDNRLTRYRGLWKLRPEFGSLRPSGECNVANVRSAEGIRFATIVPVTDSMFAYASNICRKDRECIMWLSHNEWKPSTENVQRVFSHVFLDGKMGVPDRNISWVSAISVFAENGDCAIRVFGGFDDREVVLNIIGQPENVLPSGAKTPPREKG